MAMLEVEKLSKDYGAFQLKDVSFSLESGYIMGFIGKNGAGKTTTLKSMLRLVRPDGGRVTICGYDFATNEFECKQQLGFVLGAADYYLRSKLKTITDVTKRFYRDWDEAAYRGYLERFELDENKRVSQLSAGMKVKYALALALSHNAKLLLLDEPTSGLDPVSRDDLLGLFQEIVEDGEHSILFSTHITSDLEKCADYITYIHAGEILASTELDAFIDGYRLVKGGTDQLSPALSDRLIGCRTHKFGFEAMVKAADSGFAAGLEMEKPTLEEIMIHIERKEQRRADAK